MNLDFHGFYLTFKGGYTLTIRILRQPQSRGGSCVFADGFPAIQPGTARLHPKGTSSRFALRAPRQGSASCISALSYNILSKKSKIAINPDFSGPISPFRLLSQKKSVMMEGRICNCIFHGRFCRSPALFPVHNAAASG